MQKILLLLITLTITQFNADAQLLKRVIDRTSDKITDRVADKVVEEVSNELANMAMRPFNNYMDELFQQRYREKYGEDWDDSEYKNDEERRVAMNSVWASMFGTVELPEEYSFSKAVEIDLYDYGATSPNTMWMIYGQDESLFAMEQQDGGEKQVMVYDFEKDVVAIFNQTEKTAMAIPGVMGLTKAFMPMVEEEMKKEMEETTVTKIAGKTLLDCQTQGYNLVNNEEESEFYICADAGVRWGDSYGQILEQLSPTFYQENEIFEEMKDGMLMFSTTKRKKDDKVSIWDTQQIVDTDYTIITSDYQLTNGYQE
jgi:hypothetical protein